MDYIVLQSSTSIPATQTYTLEPHVCQVAIQVVGSTVISYCPICGKIHDVKPAPEEKKQLQPLQPWIIPQPVYPIYPIYPTYPTFPVYPEPWYGDISPKITFTGSATSSSNYVQ